MAIAGFTLSLGNLSLADTSDDKFQPHVFPKPTIDSVNNAMQLHAAGNYEQAEKILTEVTLEYPDYYQALYNLGVVYQQEGKTSYALDALRRAMYVRNNKNIHDSSLINNIGWILLKANKVDEAERAFQDAYRNINENDQDTQTRILNNLGYFYIRKGDVDEARTYLNESLQRNNNNVTGKALLAQIEKSEKAAKPITIAPTSSTITPAVSAQSYPNTSQPIRSNGMRVRIVTQASDSETQRRVAALEQMLKAGGYTVERSEYNARDIPTRTEVRFFGPTDAQAASQIKSLLHENGLVSARTLFVPYPPMFAPPPGFFRIALNPDDFNN